MSLPDGLGEVDQLSSCMRIPHNLVAMASVDTHTDLIFTHLSRGKNRTEIKAGVFRAQEPSAEEEKRNKTPRHPLIPFPSSKNKGNPKCSHRGEEHP